MWWSLKQESNGFCRVECQSMVYPTEAKKLKNHHIDFKVMATEFHNVFLGFDKMDERWKDGKYVFTLYIEE